MWGKQETQGESSQSIHNTIRNYSHDGYGGGLIFPHELSPLHQWSLPPVHPSNPLTNPDRIHNPYLNLNPSYADLFNRRSTSSSQFTCDQGLMNYNPFGPSVQHGSSTFAAEFAKASAREMMDNKALAASKSHSEAERKRRERINTHLAKLRSLLPSTTKTDKASLLAEVIQHVKELKRQTSQIEEASLVPTEIDELTVHALDEDGKFIIKACLCCEDRAALLPDLIKTLKSLRLRMLKAEIMTLGGRVRNVLFVTGEEEEDDEDGPRRSDRRYCISSIEEALKAVMERSDHESPPGTIKRQRTLSVGHRSS
ncbi:hypothetical protein GIB67_041931 [Kingdonia uniflora]|uniref:BHLH domain-containing protein n=1 Tax=Kingdonia uniflora TaxID=39325 RepID=A0A7J7N185_9MAGN|nr:hypothetical protein GIB67_041931 [Kingdonia uniflora]